MEWDSNFQKVACKVITSYGYYPPDEHLGLAYICFCEDMKAHDPLRASATTYFSYRLRERLQRERQYGKLVHVPRNRQKYIEAPIVGIDSPVGTGDDMTYADILSNPTEGVEDALEAFILDTIASLYPTVSKGQQHALKAIKHEIICREKPPRNLRNEVSEMKRIIFDIYKENYLQ
jgi:hypothetical protein